MNKKLLLIILCVAFLTGFSTKPDINISKLPSLPEKQNQNLYLEMIKKPTIKASRG